MPRRLAVALVAAAATIGAGCSNPCADVGCGAGQACVDGACVPAVCSAEADCWGGTHCADGRCAACAIDGHCVAPMPACDPATHTCVACAADNHCGGSTPRCEPQKKVCVGCVGDTHCGGLTPACDPKGNVCVGCLTDADCGGPTPRCDIVGKACVECTDAVQCASGVCSPQGKCTQGGDLCDNPLPILLDSPVAGDTSQVNGNLDSGATGCTTRQAAGKDVVHRFVAPLTGRFAASLTPAAGFDASLYVITDCTQPSTSCLAGSDVRAPGGTESIAFDAVQGRPYLVVVDSPSPLASGTYTLEVRRPAQNDACGRETPLAFTGDTAAAAGDTRFATDDGRAGACGGFGNDVVYGLTLAEDAKLTITVTPAATSTSYWPAVALQSACGQSTIACAQPACGLPRCPGRPATLTVFNAKAGAYVVWVDGLDLTSGEFTLSVRTEPPVPPPPNDACAAPKSLVLLGGTAQDAGDTLAAADDGETACGGSGAPDVTYGFTLAQDSRVTVTVAPDAGSASYRPVFAIQTACGTRSEVACAFAAAAGSSAILTRTLTAGTYALWVDGLGSSAGKFTVRVDATAPVAGDSCLSPGTLTLAGSTATATGTTVGLGNDGTAGFTCGGAAGPDAVFKFSLGSAQKVTATVTPGSTLQPAVTLSSTCGTPGPTCAGANQPGATVATASVLGAGDHFVWIDGVNGTSGTYSLTVQLAAPTAGDGCANPIDLSLPASVPGSVSASGDTTGFTHDGFTACGGRSLDAVYRFNLAQAARVDATVTPSAGSGLWPTIGIHTVCGVDETGCGRATATGQAATASANLAAGTPFVWVDGLRTSTGTMTAGPYTLTLSTAAIAATDTCGGAGTVTLSGATGTASGTTAGFVDDGSPACGRDLQTDRTGNDVAYAFTLGSAAKVVASVVPGAGATGYRPIVAIQPACGAKTDSACGVASGAGGTATATANSLSAGTYAAWVDGTVSTSGPFTLTLSTSTPTPGPANDRCSGAATIKAGDTLTGDTTDANNDLDPATVSSSVCLAHPGQEVVYRFTPATSGSATVTVTPGASWDITLQVLAGTCDVAQCVADVDARPPGQAETLTFVTTAGTTYYLVVDGYLFSERGPFTISLR